MNAQELNGRPGPLQPHPGHRPGGHDSHGHPDPSVEQGSGAQQEPWGQRQPNSGPTQGDVDPHGHRDSGGQFGPDR